MLVNLVNLISGATKLGAVVRDSYGEVLLNGLCCLEKTESVLHAQIRAIHMGLQLACEEGLEEIDSGNGLMLVLKLIE